MFLPVGPSMINPSMMETAERQAAVCRAMGNARRLVILWMISKEELSVTEISLRLGSSLQNVSQHLNLLKKSGLVKPRRDGQTIYYQITDQEFLEYCPAMLRALETHK
jgi:DNA-binding transcriptional ArsR family regulator